MGNDWLESLKVGDRVVVLYGLGGREESIDRVTAVTAKQIVVGPTRYNRDTGRERGGARYYTRHLVEMTAEMEQRVRRKFAVRTLHSVKWEDYDDAALSAVMAIMKSATKLPESR